MRFIIDIYVDREPLKIWLKVPFLRKFIHFLVYPVMKSLYHICVASINQKSKRDKIMVLIIFFLKLTIILWLFHWD